MSRNKSNATGSMPASNAPAQMHHAKHPDYGKRFVRIEVFIILVGSALLLGLVSLFLALSNNNHSESKLVDTSKYQAVFLNGGTTSGQIEYTTYFGHITSLNNNYFVLNDIYYLTTTNNSQQNQNTQSNVQLTKLGCQQLHSPYDQMVVNRSQVAFWENLKDDGKVVSAIKQYKQQNPNGPNCSQTSNQSTSGGSTQTPAPTTNKTP